MKSIDEIKEKFPKVMHFTGSGRDSAQFGALCSILSGRETDKLAFLFVGCSSGEEINDCQTVMKKMFENKPIKFDFYGIDVDKDVIEIASKNQYLYPTKIIECDILKDSALDFIKKLTLTKFDIIICRNVFIYYDEQQRKKILEKLAELCAADGFLVLGQSDPIDFCIQGKEYHFAGHSSWFESVDFDNKIFTKRGAFQPKENINQATSQWVSQKKEQKIKVFGIGGMGNNALVVMENNPRLSQIMINTDICPWAIYYPESPNIDFTILCGKKLCRGLGCGGDISKGYLSAQETFGSMIDAFARNEINIFILGLGGGAGTGITQYLLEEINKYKKTYETNVLNIVICTFPLKIETKRIEKANIAIEKIASLSSMLILLEIDAIAKFLNKKTRVQELFAIVNHMATHITSMISKLSNLEIVNKVKEQTKDGKILRITNLDDVNRYFGK